MKCNINYNPDIKFDCNSLGELSKTHSIILNTKTKSVVYCPECNTTDLTLKKDNKIICNVCNKEVKV